MRPNMLLHVVLAGESLIANRTMHTLLAGVLLAVAGSMARSGERRRAAMTRRIRTQVLVLPPASRIRG